MNSDGLKPRSDGAAIVAGRIAGRGARAGGTVRVPVRVVAALRRFCDQVDEARESDYREVMLKTYEAAGFLRGYVAKAVRRPLPMGRPRATEQIRAAEIEDAGA